MSYPVPRRDHPVLDRLRQATGWSDQRIEGVIGMAEKGLYDCRKSGSIPFRHIVNAVRARVLDVDLHWLLTGEERPCCR